MEIHHGTTLEERSVMFWFRTKEPQHECMKGCCKWKPWRGLGRDRKNTRVGRKGDKRRATPLSRRNTGDRTAHPIQRDETQGEKHLLEQVALDAMDPSNRFRKDCVLFYCPEAEELAKKIARESDCIELGDISWQKFSDGFPNLYVRNALQIRNRHCAFLASFHSPHVIFEQLSIIMALPRLFIGSFTLVLPFFPTGTAERMEDEGDIATAHTLARILSHIPLSRGGPASLVVFDIHALQERFYFGDSVHPYFASGVPLLRERLSQFEDKDNIVIAYPDEGAWKRFHFYFDDYPELICTKVRDGAKRIVRLKEGDPNKKHVVIVDDLVQSGGTLLECQKLLATLGAQHVSAYVTHGVFPNASYTKFMPEENGNAKEGFKYFFITDSCPLTVKNCSGRRPFEVLSLSRPIAEALLT